MRNIGKNIREIRTNKGMTQDDLAERIHATRQTVSNYETGRSRPDIDTLILLAQALECDTETLIYGKTRPVLDPAEVRRLVIGLCILGGLVLAELVAGLIWTPVEIERYRIHPLAFAALHVLRYARTALLGWCAVQGLTALQLLRPRPCRCLQVILWCLLAVWPLFWAANLLFSHLSLSWLTAFSRLLLRLHLFPGYFTGAAVVFLLGAGLRFTQKT